MGMASGKIFSGALHPIKHPYSEILATSLSEKQTL